MRVALGLGREPRHVFLLGRRQPLPQGMAQHLSQSIVKPRREQIPQQWAFLQQAYIVGLIPYILTIIIMTGIIGKTTAPAAVGTPYEK